MMAALSINCWNCWGLSARQLQHPIQNGLLRNTFFIPIFLHFRSSETHHRTVADFPDLIKEYVDTPMNPLDTSGGIVVNTSTLFRVLQISMPLSGRIITLTLPTPCH